VTKSARGKNSLGPNNGEPAEGVSFSPEMNLDQLTLELLIENESRYKARAKKLMKLHTLQIIFGERIVEYYINENQAYFSFWIPEINSYHDSISMALPLKKKERESVLLHLFACSEAQMHA